MSIDMSNLSVWQFLMVIVGITVLPLVFTRFLEYLAERVVYTRAYLVLAILAIIVPLSISVWVLVSFFSGSNKLGWVGLFGIGSASFAYYLLLQETGCPNCYRWLPFRRQLAKEYPAYKKATRSNVQRYSSPYINIRKRRFTLERSWDLIIERTYQYYHAHYRCRTCQHEWDSVASRLVSKHEIERELSPETYRPDNPA